ncbi:hypothetical protein GmHk_07G018196 [Glycine max]|nr:hypothetical protein GmHk_07G018196 [Glycine max]
MDCKVRSETFLQIHLPSNLEVTTNCKVASSCCKMPKTTNSSSRDVTNIFRNWNRAAFELPI